MSWWSLVGRVSDLITLGGGGGALNSPSSLWAAPSLLPLDKAGWGGGGTKEEGRTVTGGLGLMQEVYGNNLARFVFGLFRFVYIYSTFFGPWKLINHSQIKY